MIYHVNECSTHDFITTATNIQDAYEVAEPCNGYF